MAIQVQVPQVQHVQTQTSPLVSSALQSILWPMRQAASQEALTTGMQAREEDARQQIKTALSNNPDLLEKMGAAISQPGQGPATEEGTPPASGISPNQSVLDSIFPPKQPYGTSTRTLENVRSQFGFAGGKTPTMAQITPEGGQVVAQKVPGAVISTPGGLTANVQAKQAPKLVSELGPDGEPIQRFETPVPGKTLTANPQNLRFRYRETVPGSGIMLDNMTGQHVISPDGKTLVPLSLNQTQTTALRFMEAKPVSNVLAIKQMAPTVQQLVLETQATLDKAKAELGPVGGRLSDLIAQKVGAGDPDYIALKTNLELLPTLVGKMHFGSRAPVEVINKFRALVDPAKMSPENIQAAMNAWSLYAEGTQSLNFGPGGTSTEATRHPIPKPVQAPQSQAFQPMPGESYQDYLKRAGAAGIK